jgi:hypothetical protein
VDTNALIFQAKLSGKSMKYIHDYIIQYSISDTIKWNIISLLHENQTIILSSSLGTLGLFIIIYYTPTGLSLSNYTTPTGLSLSNIVEWPAVKMLTLLGVFNSNNSNRDMTSVLTKVFNNKRLNHSEILQTHQNYLKEKFDLFNSILSQQSQKLLENQTDIQLTEEILENLISILFKCTTADFSNMDPTLLRQTIKFIKFMGKGCKLENESDNIQNEEN